VRRAFAVFVLAATLTLSGIAGASGRFWGPMLALPKPVRATFACIMWRESRSTFAHLNLGDNNRYGSSGIFQIEEATWLARSGFHIPVWTASPYQQELGAINLWRADGFAPWHGDGCW
jgi:hypothetical protein